MRGMLYYVIGLIVLVGAGKADLKRWEPPKSPFRVFAGVTQTNNSAVVTYVNLAQQDISDCSFTLEFDRPSVGEPSEYPCDVGLQRCFQWKSGGETLAKLTVSAHSFGQKLESASCIKVAVEGPSHKITFSHAGEHLFGGPVDDIYPSNADTKVDVPYITFEGGRKSSEKANAVVERVWYTSGGRGIRVSEDTPLFIWQNNNQLVLGAKNAHPFPTDSPTVKSEIEMVMAKNIKEAWTTFNVGRSKPLPPAISVTKPMISTWVAYKRDINQLKMIDFISQIKRNGVDIGIIGVDDGWETCYGSEIVDTVKFPDFKSMVDMMHKNGHVVTLWVHPFVNVDCEAHERLKDYLVKYDNGTVVTTTWWNGVGGMINFLNETARSFYEDRLKQLKEEYGIDGFKFDAGEVQAYIAGLNLDFKVENPNEWTKQYVSLAAKFGTIGEVRVGAGTIEQPIRQRLQDLNSVWDIPNHGLAAVIPAMLQLTVSGYGATIPDMIGGNAYSENVGEELYIRWTQMNTFLPVMQFSIPPWTFKDPKILPMTKKYIALHQKASSYMLDLWYNQDITPVIAPLWWIDPYSDAALNCNDEFLVGDQILVAPVVKEGAVTRDIYFPTGAWKDVETGIVYTGPATIRDFQAPLSKLPWFVREQLVSL